MSKARHHMKDEHRARGGAAKPMIDKGREEDEEKEEEDESRNKGGRVARKKGGSVEMGEGEMASKRLDRPGRKRGGGVGSNRMPLSTASKTSDAQGHSTGDSCEARENPSDG